mgnify:FL=1
MNTEERLRRISSDMKRLLNNDDDIYPFDLNPTKLCWIIDMIIITCECAARKGKTGISGFLTFGSDPEGGENYFFDQNKNEDNILAVDVGSIYDVSEIESILNSNTKEKSIFWENINGREMIMDDRETLEKFGNKLKILLNVNGLSKADIETVPVKVVLQWREKKDTKQKTKQEKIKQEKIKQRVDKLAFFVKNIIESDEKKASNKNENKADVYTEIKEQIVYSSFRLYINISWK